MKKFSMFFLSLVVAVSMFSFPVGTANAASSSKTLTFPEGKLISNAWRGGLVTSGNTYLFDYQVSAVYEGSKSVEYIKSSWEVCSSLRNSASLSIGVSSGDVSASTSSSWQNTCKSAYWQNSNGAKTSSWRSNATIKPKDDYKSNSVSVENVARVKLKGIAQVRQITAAV